MELAREIDADPHDVVRMSVEHDLTEVLTGDIPTPAKNKPKKEINGTVELIVSLSDTMEAYIYISRWGNDQQANNIREELIERLNDEIGDIKTPEFRDKVNRAVWKTLETALND